MLTDPFGTNRITKAIIGCGIRVHGVIGPGVYENVYSESMQYELKEEGRQRAGRSEGRRAPAFGQRRVETKDQKHKLHGIREELVFPISRLHPPREARLGAPCAQPSAGAGR
jgi:hypothetical protein